MQEGEFAACVYYTVDAATAAMAPLWGCFLRANRLPLTNSHMRTHILKISLLFFKVTWILLYGVIRKVTFEMSSSIQYFADYEYWESLSAGVSSAASLLASQHRPSNRISFLSRNTSCPGFHSSESRRCFFLPTVHQDVWSVRITCLCWPGNAAPTIHPDL